MANTKYFKWVTNRFINQTVNQDDILGFSADEIEGVLAFQATHPQYEKTPLIALNNLANRLNLANIYVKDESHRFGLNAFKIMGGIYAVGKHIAQILDRPIDELSFAEMNSAAVKKITGDLIFISATDGNHGRGVAWAARELGYKSVIKMPKGTTQQRFDAIAQEGAECEITDVNYDGTIAICKSLAEQNGWVMVQDTSWPGYQEIPLWISQGYAAVGKEIMDEMLAQTDKLPTHIFLQVGVGSFAAGMAAYLLNYYVGNKPPKIILTEPYVADCYYRSMSDPDGNIVPVTGHMDSIMAGLCCGEPSIDSYSLLKKYATASFSCADELSALGMRVLGNPLADDKKIISGESGAITAGLLHHLIADGHTDVCQQLALDSDSSILLISTEGDTDANCYRRVVWNGQYPVY